MSEPARHGRTSAGVPEPGREGAPDTTTEGVETAGEERDHQGRMVVTRLERSATGAGAGEEDIVRVETPVQHEGDDEVTRHPTLRGHSRPRRVELER